MLTIFFLLAFLFYSVFDEYALNEASTTANRGSSPEWDGSPLPSAIADGLIAAGAGGESVA